MTPQPDDHDQDALPGMSPAETDRYDEVQLGDGGLIIYDTEDEEAWVQAGDAVDLVESV
jgi:hypothetical protein